MSCRHADVRQEQGMLDKLSKGWFRLYGTLQQRAFAHGGELLYEVDLGDGASVMWAGSAWNPYSVSLLLGKHGSLSWKLIQRVFAIGFSLWRWMSQNRSCIARKEKMSLLFVILSWTIKTETTEFRSKRPRTLTRDVQYHVLAIVTLLCNNSGFLCQVLNLWSGTYTWCSVSCACNCQLLLATCLTEFRSRKTSRYFTLCQVLNLWSATYTWCSVSCACHCSLLLASCLTQFSSKRPLDTSHSVRY